RDLPGKQSPARTKNQLTPPSDEAIAAYRLCVLKGMKQIDIAAALTQEFKRPVTQGTVSRWIKQAEKWIAAGNILPELGGKANKPSPVDPEQIDLGQRQDKLTKRQRKRRED